MNQINSLELHLPNQRYPGNTWLERELLPKLEAELATLGAYHEGELGLISVKCSGPIEQSIEQILKQIRDQVSQLPSKLTKHLAEPSASPLSSERSTIKAKNTEKISSGTNRKFAHLLLYSTFKKMASNDQVKREAVNKFLWYWPLMKSNRSGHIIETLHGILKHVSHVQYAIRDFPELVLDDFISLLEPANAQYLLQFIHQLSNTSYSAQTLEPQGSPVLPKPSLYEFTIVYLTCERGSRFNRKSYLFSMLNRMAAHNNQSVESLKQQFSLWLQSWSGDEKFRLDLLDILNLSSSSKADPITHKENSTIRHWRQLNTLEKTRILEDLSIDEVLVLVRNWLESYRQIDRVWFFDWIKVLLNQPVSTHKDKLELLDILANRSINSSTREVFKAIYEIVGKRASGTEVLTGLTENQQHTLELLVREQSNLKNDLEPFHYEVFKFQQALETGVWFFTEQAWVTVRVRQRDQIKKSLLSHLVKSGTIKHIVHNFSDALLLDWVGILDVQAAPVVEEVWSVESPLSSLDDSSNDRQKKIIKEFTFAYLVFDRGSQFNQRSFSRNLIHRLANHYNLSYLEVAKVLTEQISALGLSEILPTETKQEPNTPEARGGLNLYRHLSRSILGISTVSGRQFQLMFEKLKRMYPHLVNRLIQEHLNSNVVGMRPLPLDLAKQWFSILVFQSIRSSRQAPLIMQLERLAEQLGDSVWHYAIKEVAQGRNLDLLSIKNSISQGSTRQGAKNAMKKSDRVVPTVPEESSSHRDLDGLRPEQSLKMTKKEAYDRVYQLAHASRWPTEGRPWTESQQTDVLSTLDSIKYLKLLPIVQQLRAIALSLLRNNKLTLTQSEMDFLQLRALAEQFVTVKQPGNVDRLIQFYFRLLLAQIDHNLDIDSFKRWVIQIIAGHHYPSGHLIQEVVMSLAPSELALELPDSDHSLDQDSPNLRASTNKVSAENLDQILLSGCVGIVLLNPYVPLLFKRLNLLSEEKAFLPDCQPKAIQVLNYLALGNEQAHADPLPRIICGIATQGDIHLPPLEAKEKDVCDSLLSAVIEHWSVLGNTSLAGLRHSFLQRSGSLTFHEDNGWTLRVGKQGMDVLLSRIPWGFSTLKFPFMDQVLHVEWKS